MNRNAESVELITAILGLDPYVLIECPPEADSPTGFDMKVRAGGGIEGHDEIVCLLLLLVEQLTGVDTDLYVQQVDVVRAAAGRAPLSAQRDGGDDQVDPGDQFMVVQCQIVGNPASWSYSYTSDGERFTDRQAAIDHGIEVQGHDDFCIATIRGDRIVAYGFGMDDFAPEDRDDLNAIARQLGMEASGE